MGQGHQGREDHCRLSETTRQPIMGRADDILAVVAGGHQRHMNFIPTWGYNLSATRAITRKDGAPVRAVADFLA